MDVLNVIVRNTALNGMPRWSKVTALTLFLIIVTLIVYSYVLLALHGSHTVIRFGY
ncbi:hypothetical protein [Pareuzebyella sediminis]|uniref:hypothetical protein n=1 Tax=Pareuzebyella sediminis TaxID=2607998 RepID=UPI0018E199F9|nr:hypothetical protein [Pareuzebyella sediminis]